jgi:hypothetical protein
MSGEEAMTPGDPDVLRDQLAAKALGLGPGAAVAEVRRAFLNRLRDREYFPSERDEEAFAVLTGRPVTAAWLNEEVKRAADERLEVDVEAFAFRYFTLPPKERRACWLDLHAACAGHEHHQAWLIALKPGLGLDQAVIGTESPDVQQLAAHIRALFVLPPPQRAIERRALIGKLRAGSREEISRWRRAALELRRRHSALAAIENVLLGALVVPPRRAYRSRPRFTLVTGFDHSPTKRQVRWKVSYLIWIVALLSGGLSSLFRKEEVSRGPDPPRIISQNFPILTLGPTVIDARFKANLRNALAQLGRPLDDARLQEVINAIPGGNSRAIPEEGGVDTPFQRERRALLGAALAKQGVALDDPQLRVMTRRCFPPLIQDSDARDHVKSPGAPYVEKTP